MRWEHDGTESRYSWPYRVQENIIKVEVSGQLNNHDHILTNSSIQNWQTGAGGTLIDSGARWNLFNQNGLWKDARLDLSLSIDDVDGFKKDISPPGKDPTLLFAVFTRCAVTRWRYVVTETFGNGKSDIALVIERALVRGEVEILPLIILAEATNNNTLEWASNRASILATGFPIYVWADEPEDVIPRGGLEVLWEFFPDNCRDALYKLVLSDYSKPQLYMNSRHPALTSILDSTSRVKNNRTRVRDAVFAFIASDVGMQLARYAIKHQSDSEEESDLPDMILNLLSRQIKRNRDEISSLLNEEGESEFPYELHLAIQHYRKLNLLLGDLVLEIQEDTLGGD